MKFAAINAMLLAVSVAIFGYSHFAIWMDVNDELPSDQRIYWSLRSGFPFRRCYRTFHELYPGSRLPVVAVFSGIVYLVTLVLLHFL
jgi:hypothetical protein